jgi:hypothetical protein
MNPWLQTLVVGAVLSLIGKIVYDRLAGGRQDRKHDSGGQDVSFWIAEFQEVKDKIQNVKEAVARGDIDRASIEASVEAVQHTVDRIEQKINSRRR